MDSNIFKDNQGRFRTQSLFIEFQHPDYPAPFTLKDEDNEEKEAVSMYRLYMELSDPTEYDVALTLLGSWDHWQLLAGEGLVKSWFKPHITRWRKELEIKLAREHYRRMEEIAVSGKTAAERMTAIKWLNSQLPKESVPSTNGRGRPSNQEVENELKNELRKREELLEDAKRLGL